MRTDSFYFTGSCLKKARDIESACYLAHFALAYFVYLAHSFVYCCYDEVLEHFDVVRVYYFRLEVYFYEFLFAVYFY